MRYISDIIDAVSETPDLSYIDKIEALKELSAVTKEAAFSEDADSIVDRMNICPVCYKPVFIRSHREVLGEYHGSPAVKYEYRKHCPHCGWKEED